MRHTDKLEYILFSFVRFVRSNWKEKLKNEEEKIEFKFKFKFYKKKEERRLRKYIKLQ